MGSIFGGHGDIHMIPESHFFIEELFDKGYRNGRTLTLRQVLPSITKNRRFQLWNYSPTPHLLEKMDLSLELADLIRVMVSDFALSCDSPPYHYWVDHTPMNILFADWYISMFPNAKYIHVVRDPRAVANSLLKRDWGPSNVQEFVPFWLQKVSSGLAFMRKFPNNFAQVRYEDLVADPVGTLNDISQKLEIPTIDPTRRSRTGITNATLPQHSYLDDPLRPGDSQSWRNDLTTKQIKYIEGSLFSVMTAFGYTCEQPLQRNSGYGATAYSVIAAGQAIRAVAGKIF